MVKTALRRCRILALWIGALLLVQLQLAVWAGQKPVSAAVFDFELIDTSLEGAERGKDPAETARLRLISNELRSMLDRSAGYRVVDLAPEARTIADVGFFHGCNGCDAEIGKKLGAERSITGTVRKISTLILSLSIYVRDTTTGEMVLAATADIRGNTDDSWLHGVRWLARNRLLPAIQ